MLAAKILEEERSMLAAKSRCKHIHCHLATKQAFEVTGLCVCAPDCGIPSTSLLGSLLQWKCLNLDFRLLNLFSALFSYLSVKLLKGAIHVHSYCCCYILFRN